MEQLIFKDKHKITEQDFIPLLLEMIKLEASDIYLQSGDLILMDIHGRKINVTTIPVTFNSLEKIAKLIAGDDAISRLNRDDAIDIKYEFKNDGNRYRFRINITPTVAKGQSAIQITVREIPLKIPTLSEIGLSIDNIIYKKFFPNQGMVLITGPTGSGKSTLMASCIAEKLQEEDCHRIFNTYEAPIEFVYDSVKKISSRIFQTTVNDISKFGHWISNSLRRKPEVIIVGELRDIESISAAVEAGQTGHLVISTVHTQSVPATVRRLITSFPSHERDGRQADIIDQLHMVVAQRLLRTIDGKRIAIREMLIFTPEIKDMLMNVNPLKITQAIRKIMNDQGVGLSFEAKKMFEQNIISEREYKYISSSLSSESNKL